MYFDSLSSFIEMGGHGPYVWVCYLITLLVIAYNIWRPMRMRKVFFIDLKRRLRREARK